MDNIFTLNSLFKPQEQWAMSAADNVYGMSLPEYHPEASTMAPSAIEISAAAAAEPDIIEGVSFGSTDMPENDDLPYAISELINSIPQLSYRYPDNVEKALDKLLGSNAELKAKAQKDMYEGAVLKTVAAAGDMFNRLVGIGAGQIRNIRDKASIAAQNYQNEMDALDNQVLYIKHQLADRFNKTIETNIMNLAAKNLRVTSGGVLELSKEQAQEITEDMRTAESNAELKKIALRAGQKSAKESANYAVKQLWTGLLGSATKLGLAIGTGGFTNEKWGDLYSGYKQAQAIKAESLTKIY